MKVPLTVPLSAPNVGPDEPGPRAVLEVRFHLTSATLSVVAMAVGLGVLAGWTLSVPPLKSIVPGLAPMNVNAALALLLTGAALWCYRAAPSFRLRDNGLRSCAGAAAVIAVATILEHATGWNLGIDQLLARDDVAVAIAPGRMALATAVGLVCVNAALLIADMPGRYGFAQVLIASAILLSTLNTVGYLFGLEAFAGLASYSATGVPTSLTLLVLCLGFLFARPSEGLMEAVVDGGAGGFVIRQLLPAVFFLPLLLAWLSWQGVRAGWYEPSFAMAVFVALTTNVLGYAVWAGGRLVHGFDDKRVVAEADRTRSDERFRRAVADAPVPMIIHDEAGSILHMSRGWSEISGYTAREAPTIADWVAIAQPAGNVQMYAHLETIARSTTTVRSGESTITTKGGAERVWEFSTTPLGDLHADRRAYVTMAVDVTERKTAAAELRRLNEGLEGLVAERTAELTRVNDALIRQSEQLKEQATLLDLVRDGILVRDLYGSIVYWSAGAADMYGWQEHDALGAVSHQLVATEYPRPLAEIEREVLVTGKWEGEVVQITKTGARLSVDSRWTLTRTSRGAPQGILEVNRDVSVRKRAEESLRDSESRFRAVAETAIEGIVSTDAAGTIGYWNPGAERLFGLPATAVVGQPASRVIPGRFLSSADGTGAAADIGTTFETVGRRRDGAEFPLEVSLAGWSNSQGARCFTAIARDITQRKHAERELKAKADELARSNQELEQFAYVASHDLQEPLRMVSNYTQLLGRRYHNQLDADANEFIGFAVDGAKRMQALIHDLLQYARVGTRGKEFKPVAGSLIVADAVANLGGATAEAGAEVVVDPLPVLNCDASQLVQVFQNLIGNAIKFRRPDGKPVIRVSAERADGFWKISVADYGIGIEPKYFERIFQMFQRLHGRDEYDGTGIGLALCKKIVERHGGHIGVESAPNQGTRFTFWLPDSGPSS